MNNTSMFIHYLTLSQPIGYILVFVGMIIEGDVLLFTTAFLVHQGVFNIGYMLIIVLAGAIFGDTLWYILGFRLNNYFPFLRRCVDKVARRFDNQLVNRSFHTIFISKFVYGIHHALLIRAGYLKLPFKKFAAVDFPAIILWVAVIGGFGYVAGASFASLKHYLRFAEFGLAAGLMAFFILLYFIKKTL